MAPQKRKNDAAVEKRPEKKQKAANLTPKLVPAPAISALEVEEKAFPRGGGGVLTPLEKRQIHNKARQDVLFEQTTGKKAPETLESDEEDIGATNEEIGVAEAEKMMKRKQKANEKRKRSSITTKLEQGTRIEGLSYRRLVPGSILLGQVTAINRHDVTVSLPNNLTGYLPLTAISDKVTEVVETLAAEEDDEDETEDTGESKEVRLQDYVRLGQYLRVFVSAIGEDDKDVQHDKGKRHITLSTIPQQANAGISKTDLVVDNVIQASVESVEDHGLVMNVGTTDKDVRGFMSSKEMPAGTKLSDFTPGAVMLCIITGLSSNGRIVKLSANQQKLGNLKKSGFLNDAPSVDAFLPGTAVELLISEVTPSGIVGKVMGLLDVTADLIHCAALTDKKPLEKRYQVGNKVKGRVICTFPTSEEKKLGISLLPHLVALAVQVAVGQDKTPIETLPVSSIIEEAKVSAVEDKVGLFMDIGIKSIQGFAHISRLSDEKVMSLSGTSGFYKVDSVHRARVVGYNAIDGLYILSLEKSVLEAPFLRLEDVQAGEVVKGTVEKLIVNAAGATSILVKISNNIVGLVPEMHISDVRLQNPEKKYKEGTKVTARVLNVDLERRRMRLTLKKSLVNSEAPVWKSFDGLEVGAHAPGTIVNITLAGAVVQYYGPVRAFLPVSQMSESFIEDPQEHFRVGQVVNTRVLSINPTEQRMTVSCRDPTQFGPAQQKALADLKVGSIISAVVSEKTQTGIILELQGPRLKAILLIEHLADGSPQKCLNVAKRIRVGQTLHDLLVLSKNENKHLIYLTSKPALINAARAHTFPSSLDQLQCGQEVVGFVRNITQTAVYVQFAAELVGLLPSKEILDPSLEKPDFGLRRNATIISRVSSVDSSLERFYLTQKEIKSSEQDPTKSISTPSASGQALTRAVDGFSTSMADFKLGTLTKAKVTSIKETQLNVLLADGVQGRIDVSEVFDSWDEIKDRKHPLRSFSTNQVIPVRILGMHDHRNHRFLPFSHIGKSPVFELTAKASDCTRTELDVLTLDKVKPGSEYLCFVNNAAHDCLWVNLTPNVRGRIRAIDVSDDVSLLSSLAENFPVGSALRARVLNVDPMQNRLDLSARLGSKEAPKTLNELSDGMVLPAKVTRVSDRQIIVQLSETLSGPVHLVEMADDFSLANPAKFEKNDIIRVHVSRVDVPNKKLVLSTRPSKVLSSSLSVIDPEIKSVSQLKVNDVVRGFIKSVTDNGIFVALSSLVTAFVRVSDLSDMFIKDWKAEFEVDQLVKGKVISVDPSSNHVQLSLKSSVLDKDYKAPLTYHDLKVGQIVTGTVRKVEDFGVFILVENSANVSGLCHRSEMADERVTDVKALYDEGDMVKAKVLKFDLDKRRVAFGLKASYFDDEQDKMVVDDENDNDDNDENISDNDSDGQHGVVPDEEAENSFDKEKKKYNVSNVRDINEEESDDGGVDLKQSKGAHSGGMGALNSMQGLNVGAIDWTGEGLNGLDATSDADSDADAPAPKRKRRRAEIQVDHTADLDVNGPQSSADFERLLMSEPNSSYLWVAYMAHYLQLNEVDKAREIAERAVKIINHQSRDTEGEALNVWVAYLNLENTYGTEDSTEAVFARASQYNDTEDIHSRLASIYIQSGKTDKAETLLQTMVKKFSQDPRIWLNYASFLFDTLKEPVRGRDLLPRALQALPKHHHLDLTTKFAQLEFRSPNGDSERGRTMFEGLIDTFPKRLDLYNVLLDLEQRAGRDEDAKDRIRRLFQRVTGAKKLKPKQAKFFFKRWLEYEEKEGDAKSVEKVKARAAEFVRKQQEEKQK